MFLCRARSLGPLLLLWCFLAACSDTSPSSPVAGDDSIGVDNSVLDDDLVGDDDDSTADDDLISDDDDSSPVAADPFAPLPDTSEALVNTSFSLQEVLELNSLHEACQAYEANPSSRRLMLLCGKYQFFYEGFEMPGLPVALFTFLNENFQDQLGTSFSGLGRIPNPYSRHGEPVGWGTGAPLGNMETITYTCASCHFGQLSDGRYSVGAPNYDLKYGQELLTFTLFPQTILPFMFNDSEHHPEALELVQPLRDRVSENPLITLGFGMDMLPALFAERPELALTYESEGQLASWAPGTLDFYISPQPIEDDTHVVVKIPALWDIPTPEETAAWDMGGAQLTWNGMVPDTETFVQALTLLFDADFHPDYSTPLAEYMYTLRAPENLSPPSDAAIAAGREVFNSAGCIDCHNGPRGNGLRLFSFEEIGTDDALRRVLDPDLDGEPCCGLSDAAAGQPMSHKVKAPRLSGGWNTAIFLHNGSVTSYDELLCISGPRQLNTEPIFGNQGHEFGCDLDTESKMALVDFLNSF